MSNEALVLALLQANPDESFSNSDIESRTKIKNYAQVFQITSRLMGQGKIRGIRNGKSWYFQCRDISNNRINIDDKVVKSTVCNDKDVSIRFDEITEDIVRLGAMVGIVMSSKGIKVDYCAAPHQNPTHLPDGKMAVYIFAHGNNVLKVGIAGSNSEARYTSQHYNPASANSNLAKSLLSDEEFPERDICSEENIGNWIKTNLDRVNILLDDQYGISFLKLIEAYLHCLLKPKYEGNNRQQYYQKAADMNVKQANCSNEDLEKSFDGEMRNIYQRALSECQYRATRFLNTINEHGGYAAARQLLASPKYSEGLTKLWELGRLDISMEALVLKAPWKTLFTEQELQIARKRLQELGYKCIES